MVQVPFFAANECSLPGMDKDEERRRDGGESTLSAIESAVVGDTESADVEAATGAATPAAAADATGPTASSPSAAAA
jgi:hypothetical protein